jgi:hypothetical protein
MDNGFRLLILLGLQMDRIIEILEFIKSHPGCDTDDIDYHIVFDLYKLGYLEGIDVSGFDGPSFVNLRLNISGSDYLNSLKNPKSKPNHAANPATDIVNNWHNKPIGKIFVGVSILVLFSIFIWVINHYFDLNLG